MIAATAFFAVKTLNMTHEQAMWETPMAFLFLMRYQDYYEERNGNLLTLGDKELIDSLGEK